MKKLIANNLAKANRLSINDDSLRKAAVVIGVMGHDSPRFLLTRRASKLRNHAGQFALPGGKLDGNESAEQAALRELEEELGIAADQANILGQLDDYPTKSGFCITPFVVWIDENADITPDPNEVADVFHISLDELESDQLVSHHSSELPESQIFNINLATIGHELYAPTAAIIYQFHEVAIKGQQTRVADYDEPRFAQR